MVELVAGIPVFFFSSISLNSFALALNCGKWLRLELIFWWINKVVVFWCPKNSKKIVDFVKGLFLSFKGPIL